MPSEGSRRVEFNLTLSSKVPNNAIQCLANPLLAWYRSDTRFSTHILDSQYCLQVSYRWLTIPLAFAQVLTLAGPGVVLATALTASVVKYVFPYGWEWDSCLMVGGMLSATDPVAVVALLKELGEYFLDKLEVGAFEILRSQ